ncbi:macrophage migration inhibitory factor-2 [Aphelenchoides avenae]|nr:macrophage migration inhibitory factor-2 [Aphelenchus avenae]
MPLVHLVTNALARNFPPNFKQGFVALLGGVMQKPSKDIALHVQVEQDCTIGADASQTNAILTIKSIGCLGEQQNLEYTRAITDYLGKELNIAPDRLFIHLQDLKEHEVGRFGETIKAYRAKK